MSIKISCELFEIADIVESHCKLWATQRNFLFFLADGIINMIQEIQIWQSYRYHGITAEILRPPFLSVMDITAFIYLGRESRFQVFQ